MKISRTELTPGMTVLLVIIAIPLILIALTILIVGAFVGLIVWAVTGISPVSFIRRKRERRSGPFERNRDANAYNASRAKDAAHADNGTIECEVISARTVEPDDRENP